MSCEGKRVHEPATILVKAAGVAIRPTRKPQQSTCPHTASGVAARHGESSHFKWRPWQGNQVTLLLAVQNAEAVEKCETGSQEDHAGGAEERNLSDAGDKKVYGLVLC